MISLKKLLLEEEYSEPGTQYSSGGDAFCQRGAKTTKLTDAQEKIIRATMIAGPSSSDEDKIKKIMIASQTGQFCKDAGNIANRYVQHGVTRDDLISAGLEKLLTLTWPRINWSAKNTIGTFIANEMRGHMRNAANKEVRKKGLTGIGDSEEQGASMTRLDAPVSGRDGDNMTAYDIVGGSFDNEVEEADFMQRLYRSIKPGIKMQLKSAPFQIQTLEGFLGVDENGKYTGDYRTIKDLEKDLGINHVQIRGWWKNYEDYLKKLKKNRPELFNEENARMQKIAGIK